MRLEQLVVGRRQSVFRRVRSDQGGEHLRGFALPRQRQVRGGLEELVTRLSRKVFRDDPRARAGRQCHLVLQRLRRQLDGDVRGAVTDTDDQDPLAGEFERRLRVDVVVRVDGLAGERAGKVRQPSVPVVSVADDQQVELPGGTGLILDRPAAVGRPGTDHTVAELDVVQQPEGIGVGVEVGLDFGMVRKRRKVVGNREVLEGQPMLGRVDVQRPVCAAVPVGVSECPVATDAVRGLEGGVRNAVVLEHLSGRQATDPGTDDRGARG